ncbi:MAG: phytoene/squalene synthase family protein [Pseudomonadota bacterium]
MASAAVVAVPALAAEAQQDPLSETPLPEIQSPETALCPARQSQTQLYQIQLSKADVRACRRIIRDGSKSFYFASLVLPQEVRDAALALYSFCRISDDMVDDRAASQRTLDELRGRIAAAYQGQPRPQIADRALAHVVARYGIPQSVLLALVEGYEWDLAGKRYDTLSDVLDYSARVAGTVGVMMTLIMRRRTPRALARAADLGVAMQLTNIARDVGEDARAGRLYLPRQWLLEAGLDGDAFLANPVFTDALGSVIERLLREADRLYRRGFTGLSDLPLACRPGIRAAGLVYREIGMAVRRNGFDAVSQRAHTSRQRKLALLAQAVAGTARLASCDPAPPLPQTAFLVDAAASTDTPEGGVERFVSLLHTQHCRQMALAHARRPRQHGHIRLRSA